MKETEYKKLINIAMLGVVRSVMRDVSTGVAGNFFITFSTQAASMSDALRIKYPNEMSIILQHQFRDLQVSHESFAVTLSFSGVEERLVVPFSSISYFLDRDCDFSLEFHNFVGEGGIDEIGCDDTGGTGVPETGTQKKRKIIDFTDILGVK